MGWCLPEAGRDGPSDFGRARCHRRSRRFGARRYEDNGLHA